MKINPSVEPYRIRIGMKPEAIKVMDDGREVCNLRTVEGERIYDARIEEMWHRQVAVCCLSRYIRECPGRLELSEATFEHEDGRGMGGGHRDDRTWKDGKRYNGAAHGLCNQLKGSRRIDYNGRDQNGAQGVTTPSRGKS